MNDEERRLRKEDAFKALVKMWMLCGDFVWILGSIALVLTEVTGTDTDQTLLFSIIAYGYGLNAYFGYRLNTMELKERMEKLEHAAEME